MNFKYSAICIVGLSIALIGCNREPKANAVNCSGNGMVWALTAFEYNEAKRQAFIDECNALKKEN